MRAQLRQSLTTPDDITKSSVQFTAKVASLDTGVKTARRLLDQPESNASDKKFIAYGDLKIKKVTKQIALPASGVSLRYESV